MYSQPAEYSGQQNVKLLIVGSPFLLSTTVTSGLIASATVLDAQSLITNFATRFNNCFAEYRAIRYTFRLRPLTVSTGVSRVFFAPVTPPALIDAQERNGRYLANTSADTKSDTQFTYIPRDTSELAFNQTNAGPSGILQYFCVYTNGANFGAPVTVVPLWFIQPEILVEFRGINSA
jgi:hypothetical protein